MDVQSTVGEQALADKIFSVSEINKHIKTLLDKDIKLNNVQVTGEISNFKRYPSGHCYFTLKDNGAVLKCVMFGSRANTLKFEPVNGDTVIAVGRITAYERDGVYQLYTDIMLQQGVGDLMLAYERLKKKLAEEGLFAEENKQQLPLNPPTVGIITSSAGAAVRDIITVGRRRNPGIKLLLYPVKVQGQDASPEIAAAIKFFNKHKLADILIVGRGGGSIEDLWAFNEELTVRAVADSKIPVISAVGHETDFTLCDFAADKRAATPSQAAEIAVPNIVEYTAQVLALQKRCVNLMTQKVHAVEAELKSLTEAEMLKKSERIFADKILRFDFAWNKLNVAVQNFLEVREQRFAMQTALLESMSPLTVLSRGYSVTQNSDYEVVDSTDKVRWGDELVTIVSDGTIRSVVQEVEGL